MAALAMAAGVFLATGTAAEPPQPAPAAEAVAEGALDTFLLPELAATPEPARAAPQVPEPAQSAVWRGGARPPGEVPAGVVVRAALRTPSPGKRRADRDASEPPRVIEIVWNAPGS